LLLGSEICSHYGNFRGLEDVVRNLAVRVSRRKLRGGDANFDAHTQGKACTESACNELYSRVLNGIKDYELERKG